MMTRRQAIKTTALASAGIAIMRNAIAQPRAGGGGGEQPLDMLIDAKPAPFTLPPLPYDYAALEPFIDAETMHIHHDKHHAAYVANLNKAVAEAPDLNNKSIGDLLKNLDSAPEKVRLTVR